MFLTVPREAIHQVDRVMASLREWDGHQDGFAAINRRLDAAQEAWETARKNEQAAFTEDRANAAYDHIQWQAGHRLATSDMSEGAETSDAIEQHDGFAVRVRKGALLGSVA